MSKQGPALENKARGGLLMYRTIKVETSVPEGFADSGRLEVTAWIRDKVTVDCAIRAVKRYFQATEAVCIRFHSPGEADKAPEGIYAHVMDINGEYLAPEVR